MSRLTIIVLYLFILSGCGFTPKGDEIREFVKIHAEKTADQSFKNALDYLCDKARIGAIGRVLRHSQKRAGYMLLCSKPSESAIPPLKIGADL